jgi:hypothetical protein
MTDCPSCRAPLKDGDWTCGRCGAPVAGAGTASGATGSGYPPAGGARPDPYGYAPGYAPQPGAASAPASAGASGTLRLVVILTVLALVAIVAVWFFVVRGPAQTSGDEFLGTWTSAGSGIVSVVIARPVKDFEVTLTGAQATQTMTVPAHVDGDELKITVDDFATLAGEADAERFKDMLKALAGDFSIVFAGVDATHLRMTIEGSTSGREGADTATLTKATP